MCLVEKKAAGGVMQIIKSIANSIRGTIFLHERFLKLRERGTTRPLRTINFKIFWKKARVVHWEGGGHWFLVLFFGAGNSAIGWIFSSAGLLCPFPTKFPRYFTVFWTILHLANLIFYLDLLTLLRTTPNMVFPSVLKRLPYRLNRADKII